MRSQRCDGPVPQMPERTATAAELADHTTWTGRALTGRQASRTVHAACEQAARLLGCDHCGARPSHPCATGPDGYHPARFAAGYRRGLVSGPEIARLIEVAGVFTSGRLIRDER